jgi:hypothetical protein
MPLNGVKMIMHHDQKAYDRVEWRSLVNTTLNLGFFEVCIEVKSSTFLDRAPCSPVKGNRRFGETYRLHLQARRARNQYEAGNKQ